MMLREIMNRKQCLAVTITAVIIASVGVSIMLLNNEGRPASDLSWNVKNGDSYIYELESIYRYLASDYNASIFTQMAELNHTRIKMDISSLPDIPPMIDGETFSIEIINKVKTYCTFENGSELPLYYRDRINRVLSSCVLPVGNWNLLDWCFADEVSQAFYPGAYTSKLQENHFMIGYELWPVDSIYRWSANISIVSGIPQAAFSEQNSYIGTQTIIRFVLVS
jgi:hypothetical protein